MDEMSSVYVVVGSCGEYGDYTEWLVRAFPARRAAEAFRRAVTREYEKAKRECIRRDPAHGAQWYCELEPGMNKLDPAMRGDYTGVEYEVRKVPLGR